jgi:LysM repeat protein
MATAAQQPRTVVIYVFRAGDSLANIATRYGLSPEQIAEANGLDIDAAVADGIRLIIPLAPTPGFGRPKPGSETQASG